MDPSEVEALLEMQQRQMEERHNAIFQDFAGGGSFAVGFSDQVIWTAALFAFLIVAKACGLLTSGYVTFNVYFMSLFFVGCSVVLACLWPSSLK